MFYEGKDFVCMETDAIFGMSLLPDNSVDLILCDLPYGITQNKWDTCIPFDRLWEQYLRVIKPNGAVALMSAGAFTAKVILSQERLFKYKWVWEKSKATNFLNAKKQPLRKYEEVVIFYSSQPTYNPQMTRGEPYDRGVRKDALTGSYGDFKPVRIKSGNGDRYPSDVLYFKTAETEGEVLHPTQKPVALCEYMIRTYTVENEVVLDCCMGAGTTGAACARTKRRFTGFEIDSEYADIAVERIKKEYAICATG